jgi:hypothetical protein
MLCANRYSGILTGAPSGAASVATAPSLTAEQAKVLKTVRDLENARPAELSRRTPLDPRAGLRALRKP